MAKKSNGSGPQKHHGDANKQSPHEFKAAMHKGAKRGDWQGSYEPVPPKVNVVKILRELNGRKENIV